MKVVGWIRFGDRAACGGTVIEGDVTCVSRGRAYSFQGARLSCRKNCIIAEGAPQSILTNGRIQVLHGMRTSSGCPLQSTLNDIDGVGNADDEDVPIRFVLDEHGEWIGKMNEGYDQHFLLTDELTGELLVNRHYKMRCNGQVIQGKTGADGKTERITSDDPATVTLEIMPEGYDGVTE